jgi:RNA polymerase sigma factor (sigma-70 family)
MLLCAVEARSVDERNRCFADNVPLAYWALSHLLDRHPTLRARLRRRYQREDLEQVALVALLKSCAAVDPARGTLATLVMTTLRRDLLSAARRPDCRRPLASVTAKIADGLAAPSPALSPIDLEWVASALAQLDAPSRLVVRHRFGLDGGEEWDLDAIARAIGISRQRVRQLERRALDRLAIVLGGHGMGPGDSSIRETARCPSARQHAARPAPLARR